MNSFLTAHDGSLQLRDVTRLDGVVGACANVRNYSFLMENKLKDGRDRLDGNQKQIPFSALLKQPDLRHRASTNK